MADHKNLHQSEDSKTIPMTSTRSGQGEELRPDVYYYTNQIVNVIMIGKQTDENWVLVDAGMPNSGDEIISAAAARFGEGNKPAAIILTHGHFDHVGSVVKLIEEWNVPVFAHPDEFPYLTGKRSYPDPDPSVEGGMLAKMSSIYPHEPINIEGVLQSLPENGALPHLPEWKWIHVPGHSAGQVALFRERDRTLIAADAFVTVQQDSFYKVLTQKTEVHGPPVYLTTNWNAAHQSVVKLKELNPEFVISGHGRAMMGEELKKGLNNLAQNFKEAAVPDHGEYVLDED